MYITVNNVKLYYECHGEGKPVLFIPGNGTSFKYMLNLAKLLANEYKVYLIDRRGQGKSTKKCDLTYELNVQDIYVFIQKLNIYKPHIVAHSGGAMIAMMLTAKHTNITDKIVLCSGTTSLQAIDEKTIKRWKMQAKFGIIPTKIINMALNFRDLKQTLNKITVNALILAGEKDIINSEDTNNIASLIPNAECKIYKKENHSSYITKTVCYKDIKNFLKED